jgi:hypothetical protein
VGGRGGSGGGGGGTPPSLAAAALFAPVLSGTAEGPLICAHDGLPTALVLYNGTAVVLRSALGLHFQRGNRGSMRHKDA